jgi:hypothetical protein
MQSKMPEASARSFCPASNCLEFGGAFSKPSPKASTKKSMIFIADAFMPNALKARSRRRISGVRPLFSLKRSAALSWAPFAFKLIDAG